MPGGRVLTASGNLAASEWIVVAEADAGLRGGRKGPGRIFAGALLSEAAALDALAPLIKESIDLEWQGLVPRARRRKSAGAILLSESALAAPPLEAVASALATRVAREGPGILPWEEKAGGETPAALLARMRWYARYAKSETWPGLSDAELAEGAASWLAPFAASPGPAITAGALAEALRSLPDHAAFRRFEREAPRELELPSGRSARLEYDDTASGPGGSPVGPLVEGRPSDFYGLGEQPRILGIPVVIRLLSPAGRPIHTTSDLPGFWRGSWLEVRKDMRGRYPKHDWPEDPSAARPSVASVKRRA
jgi:ATP-dependent helicase HrpB